MAETSKRPWVGTVRKRLLVAAAVFALWGVAIEARLVYLQVFQHDALKLRAEKQTDRTTPLEPRRGDIIDRRGQTLALSVDADSICAVPKHIDDPVAVVEAVCWVLGDCTAAERQELVQRLKNKKREFAYLRRKVSRDVASRVLAQGLPTVHTRLEPRRFYPNRELAAHVLGYLNLDNKGVSGVEQSYNSKVSGKPGAVFVEIDANGEAFSREERAPVPGDSLELTIDSVLQHVAERELAAGIARDQAQRGSVIVMDPRSGEVLALANYPSFNPNEYQDVPEDRRRNRAVQEIYEPGSTFKIVTASAALEEQVFHAEDLVDASAGVWRLGSRTVREAKNHNYGVLSFRDVIVKSSNVGAIKIGLSLGAERLGRYVHRFGFGTRVFGDLPGESRGQVASPTAWSQGTIASISMGYEVGVTPMQMAAAFSAVANGGIYMQPRIVRALRRGTARTEVTPQEVRRAITPETAAALVEIMEGVVGPTGTGQSAALPGYQVAGKTGTAAMIVNRRYSDKDYYTSFVGFLPSRQPAVTILVVVEAPRGPRHYGGNVAAPIFKKIAEVAVQRLGIAPTLNPAAPVLVRADAEASEAIVPAFNNTLAAPRLNVVDGPPAVPDVRGLAAREAVRRLAKFGLVVRLTGSGTVIDQDPAAGSPIEKGRACRLYLDRILISPPPSVSPQ
jgi:cell division protein FtsI (penicillin-binding protein 3)